MIKSIGFGNTFLPLVYPPPRNKKDIQAYVCKKICLNKSEIQDHGSHRKGSNKLCYLVLNIQEILGKFYSL